MTNQQQPGAQPQLMTNEKGPWNTLAIVAFIVPFVVFILGQTLGTLLGTKGNVPDGSNLAATQEYLRAQIPALVTVVIVQFIGYVVGVVLAHMSLRAALRGLRGRGLGIAGLVLSYLGVALTVLGIVSLLALPALLNANS